MKQRVFFADKERLIEFLHKYGKDEAIYHEINISLYAKEYWEKKMQQEFVIVFEQNDKMHKYPERFTPTTEELKDIFENFLKTDTPVDFGLAPITSFEEYNGFAYPFQVKQKRLPITEDITQKLADFISEKANRYNDVQISLIIDPQLQGDNKERKMFSLDQLKELLTIRDDAIRAVYIFQNSGESFNFLPLWVSPLVVDEIA